jgi:hemerythrin-like domain-containing protein
MGGILETLRSDHANMARLLNILERQVSAFHEGEAPDYEIVEAVVAYFLDYPDLCHHPIEDLLARTLLDKTTFKDSAIRGLAEQHEELGGLTRRFAKVVRRVIDEAELPRDYFIRAAKEFIGSQRQHMQMEEEYFFPLAEGGLTPQDLAALDSELFDKEDPLFGGAVKGRFEALYNDIVKWERAEQEG